MGNESTKRNREQGSGQYTFTGGFERACVCSHELGIHTAERSRDASGKVGQPCLGPGYMGGCSCACFKPARRAA